MKNLYKKVLGGIFVVFILGVFFGYFFIPMNARHSMMNMDQMRDSFISLKTLIQKEDLQDHNYRCCLEKPCTYCIEKTPGHGKGSVCDCLSDIMNGVHPCGECIGEILEGNGNPLLAEYFAKAIAEKTGHIDAVKEIISEKYGMPIEKQL